MKNYQFRAEIEPDEDGWYVRCPTLERYGADTWGETKEEAHQRIEEVLGLVLESMIELGMAIPNETDDAALLKGYLVSVSIESGLKAISNAEHPAKTYQFRVVVEPDEDQWIAFCPTLTQQGAATGGRTREEAYINIHQVLRMTLESMIFHGEAIPIENPAHSGDIVAVTI